MALRATFETGACVRCVLPPVISFPFAFAGFSVFFALAMLHFHAWHPTRSSFRCALHVALNVHGLDVVLWRFVRMFVLDTLDAIVRLQKPPPLVVRACVGLIVFAVVGCLYNHRCWSFPGCLSGTPVGAHGCQVISELSPVVKVTLSRLYINTGFGFFVTAVDHDVAFLTVTDVILRVHLAQVCNPVLPCGDPCGEFRYVADAWWARQVCVLGLGLSQGHRIASDVHISPGGQSVGGDSLRVCVHALPRNLLASKAHSSLLSLCARGVSSPDISVSGESNAGRLVHGTINDFNCPRLGGINLDGHPFVPVFSVRYALVARQQFGVVESPVSIWGVHGLVPHWAGARIRDLRICGMSQ